MKYDDTFRDSIAVEPKKKKKKTDWGKILTRVASGVVAGKMGGATGVEATRDAFSEYDTNKKNENIRKAKKSLSEKKLAQQEHRDSYQEKKDTYSKRMKEISSAKKEAREIDNETYRRKKDTYDRRSKAISNVRKGEDDKLDTEIKKTRLAIAKKQLADYTTKAKGKAKISPEAKEAAKAAKAKTKKDKATLKAYDVDGVYKGEKLPKGKAAGTKTGKKKLVERIEDIQGRANRVVAMYKANGKDASNTSLKQSNSLMRKDSYVQNLPPDQKKIYAREYHKAFFPDKQTVDQRDANEPEGPQDLTTYQKFARSAPSAIGMIGGGFAAGIPAALAAAPFSPMAMYGAGITAGGAGAAVGAEVGEGVGKYFDQVPDRPMPEPRPKLDPQMGRNFAFTPNDPNAMPRDLGNYNPMSMTPSLPPPPPMSQTPIDSQMAAYDPSGMAEQQPPAMMPTDPNNRMLPENDWRSTPNPARDELQIHVQNNPQDRTSEYALSLYDDLIKQNLIKSPEDLEVLKKELPKVQSVRSLGKEEKAMFFSIMERLYGNMT